MDAGLRRADAAAAGCFLFTASEANVAWYRQFSFNPSPSFGQPPDGQRTGLCGGTLKAELIVGIDSAGTDDTHTIKKRPQCRTAGTSGQERGARYLVGFGRLGRPRPEQAMWVGKREVAHFDRERTRDVGRSTQQEL